MNYKGFIIKPHKLSPMNYSVVTEGQGGKIPAILDTLFTSTGIAKEAIDSYLETKPKKKDVENAKTDSES